MRTMVLLVGLILWTANVAEAQTAPDMFKHLPKTHWVYEANKSLATTGLMRPFYTGYFGSNRPFTRYEVTVLLVRSLDAIKEIQRTSGTVLRSGQPDGLRPKEVATLMRFCREFRQELAAMGGKSPWTVVSAKALLEQVQGIAEPFKDVAPNHWAYGSVERLREKSILLGYPDGSFRGTPQWKMGLVGGAAK
jgi:hypothetical protein